MTDLLPCPFCGCESLWTHMDEWNCVVVECNWCDAKGPYISLGAAGGDEHKALQMAGEAWNQRAPAKEQR